MTTSYKVAAGLVLGVFIFYVFDIRSKKGMVPLVATGWTLLLKIMSVLLFVGYAGAIALTSTIGPVEIFAFVMTFIGAALVTTAKITLGQYHTWTGYHMEKTKIVDWGIYSRMRHPLYTGIVFVEIGGAALVGKVALAAAAWILAPVVAGVAYALAFNISLAAKESETMAHKFGPEFEEYRSRVHAWLPIRRGPRKQYG